MKSETPSRLPIGKSERIPLLEARRERKMTSSAHAYVRGSTHRFYEWLESTRGQSLPKAPSLWIGGDCHVGNIGPIARKDGGIELELRDLDQTSVGSPAHDVIRLALSMAMAVRAAGLAGATTLKAIEAIARGYETVLEHSAARREFVLGAPPLQVMRLLKQAGGRSRKDLFSERLGKSQRTIPMGKRFWPLTDEERKAVEKLAGTETFRKLLTSLNSRSDDAPVELVDAAYWVKGCSSLGTWRCAALVQVGTKKEQQLTLIDIKEALATVAPRSKRAKMPKHHGERVVTGARHLSPYLGNRMMSSTVMDIPVVIRELLPQDLKFELEVMSDEEAIDIAAHLGSVVGIAHARQLDPKKCAAWLTEFRKEQAAHTQSPAWLWAAVVDLVALHEGAYLEHCRAHLVAAVSPTGQVSDILSHHAAPASAI